MKQPNALKIELINEVHKKLALQTLTLDDEHVSFGHTNNSTIPRREKEPNIIRLIH